jgi:hypothetical protein
MHRLKRWQPLIQASPSEQELVTLLREYCESFEPGELARLPTGTPTPVVATGDEIIERAIEYNLLELRFRGPDEVRSVLVDLALAFRAAAQRVRALRASAAPATTS